MCRPSLLLFLFLVACTVERPVPNRGQAMAFAVHWCEERDWDLGPVAQIWPPDPARSAWRDDWEVHFTVPDPRGDPVVLLVDARSGWVRRAPPDHPRRLGAPGPGPLQTHPGPWLLVLAESAGGADLTALAERHCRLDADLRQVGLPDLAVLRPLRAGAVQLVYGWDGTTGIQRAEVIARRVGALVPDLRPRWIDLRGATPPP